MDVLDEVTGETIHIVILDIDANHGFAIPLLGSLKNNQVVQVDRLWFCLFVQNVMRSPSLRGNIEEFSEMNFRCLKRTASGNDLTECFDSALSKPVKSREARRLKRLMGTRTTPRKI